MTVKVIKRETYTIDATDKALGRLASEIAIILRGKHRSTFQPNKDGGDFVIVKSMDKVKITGRKLKQKVYYKHSSFPGGLKEIPMEKLFKQNPLEVLKRAVLGMLPKNKLRSKMIKRLKVERISSEK